MRGLRLRFPRHCWDCLQSREGCVCGRLPVPLSPSSPREPLRVGTCVALTDMQVQVATVLADPGRYTRRRCWVTGEGETSYEDLHVWQARALTSNNQSGPV